MFCGNCGDRSVEGDRYCIRCGREQSPTPPSQSPATPLLRGAPTHAEMTSTVKVATSVTPVDRAVATTATLVKPAERPLYCRHSPSERSTLGRQGQDGSETCAGCGLPYAPGSPGSDVSGAADHTRMSPVATAPSNFRPDVPRPTQLMSSLPFSGKAIAAFVLSLFWLGGIGSIVAIFLATGAMQDVRQGTRSGHGLAVAALVLAIVGIVLSVVGIILVMYMGQDLNNQFNQISDCVNSPTAPGCP
jgi:hypothetical protein